MPKFLADWDRSLVKAWWIPLSSALFIYCDGGGPLTHGIDGDCDTSTYPIAYVSRDVYCSSNSSAAIG